MRRRAQILLTTMALALVLASGTAVAAEPQLDQQQPYSNGQLLIDKPYMQTFTVGRTGTLDQVGLYIGCCKDASGQPGGVPPGALDVSLVVPNGVFSKVVASAYIPASAFGTSDGSLSWWRVGFNVPVRAGEQYAIHLSSGGTGGPYYLWGYNDPGGSSGGEGYLGGELSYLDREAFRWISAGDDDAAFETYVVSSDSVAPTVGSVSPVGAATGVALTANVETTFSEAMDPTTLTTSTFTLTKQGSSTPVAAHVAYDSASNKATLDPASDLEANTTYTAIIKGGTSGAKDLAGNALAQDHVWNFTTASPPPLSCTITGTANAETVSGTSGDDVICAGGGNDTVKGFGGNDILKGEAGNDTLLGDVGNDTLDGGLGTDTASYSASLTAVNASLATNSSTGEGSDTFLGVENLLGSSKADTLTGSATNNKLTGGGGPDTEQGGLGNDTVVGSGGADILKGEGGDDTVNSKDGVKGNDTLDGGAGTDTKVTDTTEKSIVGFP